MSELIFFSCVLLVFPEAGDGKKRLPVVDYPVYGKFRKNSTTRSAAKTITGQKSYGPRDGHIHTHTIDRVHVLVIFHTRHACAIRVWTIRVEIDFGCPRTGRAETE